MSDDDKPNVGCVVQERVAQLLRWIPVRVPALARRIVTAFNNHLRIQSLMAQSGERAIIDSVRIALDMTSGQSNNEADRVARASLLSMITLSPLYENRGNLTSAAEALGQQVSLLSRARRRAIRRKADASQQFWNRRAQRRGFLNSPTVVAAVQAFWLKASKPSPSVRDLLKYVRSSVLLHHLAPTLVSNLCR